MTDSSPTPWKLLAGWVKVLGALALIGLVGTVLDWFANLPRVSSLISFPVGLVVLSCGILLEAYATITFWKEGAGTPHPAFAPLRLVTQGPYRYSRNPLYVARIVMLTGISLAAGSPGISFLTLLLIVGLQFVIIPREEIRLRAKFGSSYCEYEDRVSRWVTLTRKNQRGALGETGRR